MTNTDVHVSSSFFNTPRCKALEIQPISDTLFYLLSSYLPFLPYGLAFSTLLRSFIDSVTNRVNVKQI